MAQPRCEWCYQKSMAQGHSVETVPYAQYDFVSSTGGWRYGCTAHWLEYRESRQLAPGHARHIEKGVQPAPRAPGDTPPPLPPYSLAKPQERTVASPTAAGSSPGGGATKAPRSSKPKKSGEFCDMERDGTKAPTYVPRPDSVLAFTLELVGQKDGATLEDIQAMLDTHGKHNALKLLEWSHDAKGYGWKKGDDGKIRVVR